MYKIKVKLRPHQQEAIRSMVSYKEWLVFASTGSGKSVIQISAVMYLLNKGYIDRGFIVGTKSSIIELEKEINDRTNLTYSYVEDEYSLEQFKKNDSAIGLMTYSKARRFILKKDNEYRLDNCLYNYLKSIKCAFVFDEVDNLKNDTAQTTIYFRSLRPVIDYCYGLTATPIKASIYDLYHIVNFIKNNYFGSIWKFKKDFLNIRVKKFRKHGKQVRVEEIRSYRNLDLLTQMVEDISTSYYPKSDISYFKIDAVLKNEYEYRLASKGVLNEPNPKQHSARLIDLQQVVNQDISKIKAYETKAKELKENGFITYCSFYDTVEIITTILEQLKIDTKIISGKVATKDRIKAKNWFIENPSNKCLIITDAGGSSLNLQAVNDIVFYDIPFSVGKFIQTIGRIVRLFSEYDNFNVYFIVVTDTIDDYKYALIERKKDLIQDNLKIGLLPSDENKSMNKTLIGNLRKKLLWRQK